MKTTRTRALTVCAPVLATLPPFDEEPYLDPVRGSGERNSNGCDVRTQFDDEELECQDASGARYDFERDG